MQTHPIPLGLCECGCGEATNLSPQSNTKRGYVRGYPMRFLPGHYARRHLGTAPAWIEEDRGYKTCCWVWQRCTNRAGYGLGPVKGGQGLAHRITYEKRHGLVPEGRELDHLCRIPACVNPDHLEPVTHTENMRRGASSTLTLAAAAQARLMKMSTSLTQTEIADVLGVRFSVVNHVIHGRTWRF